MYNYEKKDERKLVQQLDPEPLIFNGRLEDFAEKDYIRRVSWAKALQQQSKQIRGK